MTKVLYFPPAYVSSQPTMLDLTDTAAAALVASGAGAYPVPMPLDRPALVVKPSSGLPLVDPIMFVIGASLEALSYRGTQTPYSYGYSAQGPINWVNYLSEKRLFTVQMGPLRGAFPWYSRPSASASGSAAFTQAGNSGPSINGQVDQVLAAIQNVPAGRQICVYYTGGRNALEGSSIWLPKELANIDKLLAEPRISYIFVPGLWKRDTASGGDWRSGGNDRARVDAINAKYPDELAARGPRVVFMPLQDVMVDPSSPDGNPKPGSCIDWIHYTQMGGQITGRRQYSLMSPYFAGVERTPGTNLLAFAGATGTIPSGATGALPTGFIGTKDPTVGVAFAMPASGTVAVTVTRAEVQATVAEGATVTSAPAAATSGGKYRGQVRVKVQPTPLPISLSAYLSDMTPGANQRVHAIYANHATAAGTVFTETATAAIDPLDASAGLDVWFDTPMELDVAAAANAAVSMVVATSVNQGAVGSYTVEVSEWRIVKVADASNTTTPAPTPEPTPAPTSYKQLTGAGWFDASQTAGDNKEVTSFANRRAGKGDLARVGTGGSIISVPNGRNNRPILRLVRDVSASAATPHLAAATDAAISSMWIGDDRPFFAMAAYMPTDGNTGPIWGSALDTGTNLDHVAQYRRSGTASTIRKKSGSASQIDVPTSTAAGDVAGTPVIVAVLHDGKKVTTWSNSTTPTTIEGAQDVASISGPQVFRLFAHKVNGNILNAQCNMDFYEAVFEETSIPTPQRVAAYIVEMAGDWAIPITNNA